MRGTCIKSVQIHTARKVCRIELYPVCSWALDTGSQLPYLTTKHIEDSKRRVSRLRQDVCDCSSRIEGIGIVLQKLYLPRQVWWLPVPYANICDVTIVFASDGSTPQQQSITEVATAPVDYTETVGDVFSVSD